MEPVLLTVKDACKMLGLGSTKVNELIGKNDISSIKVGRRRLVVIQSVREFVLRNSQGVSA